MNTNLYPELRKYLPIDIDKCEDYWNEKINGTLDKSIENPDWQLCRENLHIINNKSLPITMRTYFLACKIPFIIANYIIEGKAKVV